MGKIAKLDMYDYLVLPGVIRVKLSSSSDPILVDILSEISNSYDLIYIEGLFYNFLDEYEIFSENGIHWLEISVVEIRGELIDDILKTKQ